MSFPQSPKIVTAYAALFTVAFGMIAFDRAARHDATRTALAAASTPRIEPVRPAAAAGLDGSKIVSRPASRDFTARR